MLSGTDKRSELKAVVISALTSSLFLFTFVLLFKPVPPKAQQVVTSDPSPTPVASMQLEQTEEQEDPNEKYRIVPESFSNVDFENWSYGPYTFGGKRLILTLTQGEHVYPRKEGGGGETFSLSDVLYADVNGDGRPEAIVFLSHVDCGGSCDGGAALFYVYENSKNKLRRIWEYETGSAAYGCGLKSLTVSKKQIALEMFGQCWQPASSFSVSGKFLVRDVTRSVFQYDGRRFVKRLTEVTAAPVTDLRSYTPKVHISE